MKQILNKLIYRIFSSKVVVWLLGEEECSNWRGLFSNSIVYNNYYMEIRE